MGVVFDYFSAASDEEAATVIDRVGGPISQATITPPAEPRRGIFGRKRQPAAVTYQKVGVFDAVSGNGIDPVVQLGTLEELLTGRPFDDVMDDPRSGQALADREGGERLVLTLTEPLCTALATASDEALEQVAIPWSETEEFWNAADPALLADFLKDLAGLARRSEASGQRLYCWVCV
ncbi:hypothetical protein [Paenarthrobacter nicotinovorans]|uniref:hypothetical protein n=1 Tax=Paenarthrobacter nicotinovorans TaxID=29320 RepID=UPI00119DA739|nr:hypothetical protein [Paenarthrobacter nicotinovorans]